MNGVSLLLKKQGMPPRKKTRAARSRTVSENIDDDQPPPKKQRPRRKTVEDGTNWVDDDTIEQQNVLVVEFSDEDDDSDYNPDEEIEVNEAFVKYFFQKYVEDEPKEQKKKRITEAKPPIKLNSVELAYYNKQTPTSKKNLLDIMNRISGLNINDSEIPQKFRILELQIPDYLKSIVVKKLDVLYDMSSEGGGESNKLRLWIDAFMKIPFGKTVPLPVQLSDGQQKCTDFMVKARKNMDTHIYGLEPAKLQIMQIISQWLVNPSSVGNVIALHGPMGVGKTSLARNAIAQVLQRPFEFFTLGGASDIANFIGHSYTYEGSTWGRIVDSLMHAGAMNPVMYFDELDKVSTTPQGDEIISMMIHMTDRSQNTQFHDRYFTGVDFDISQCLFVFSFNDIEKVHPILRDRMTVIHCSGYSESEKIVILKDYILPEILERLRFSRTDVVLTDQALKYIISEYSSDEKGVRTLIRTVESMMTRINMLRITKHESMRDYKFYMDIDLPLTVTETVVKKILCDYTKKETETWRSLYN